MQDYRRLRVHANAHALALRVRAATTLFPKRGYASLTGQITSAAESIAFNIVEGCAASSAPEFARFLDIGIKSATELEYQLALARDYGVLRYRAWRTLTVDTIDVRKMLFGLRAKVRAKPPAGQERKNGQRKNGQRKNGQRTTG